MGAYTAQSTVATRSAATTSNFPTDEEASSSNAAAGSGALASTEIQSCKANLIGNKDNTSNLAAPNAPSATTSQVQNQNISRPFQINDRVRISATREACIALQPGHGGWNPRMESV